MTGEKIEITKITVKIGDEELVLPIEVARKLRDELNKLFGAEQKAGDITDAADWLRKIKEVKERRDSETVPLPWRLLSPTPWPQRQWEAWWEVQPTAMPGYCVTTCD